MKTRHNAGQALVETLVSLPIMLLGVSVVIAGLHSLFLFYLSDHWVYQSSLCLVEEKSLTLCRNNLVKKINQLPFSEHQLIQFRSHNNFSHVKIRLTTPVQVLEFDEKISNSLNSEDFGRAQ